MSGEAATWGAAALPRQRDSRSTSASWPPNPVGDMLAAMKEWARCALWFARVSWLGFQLLIPFSAIQAPSGARGLGDWRSWAASCVVKPSASRLTFLGRIKTSGRSLRRLIPLKCSIARVYSAGAFLDLWTQCQTCPCCTFRPKVS